MQTLFFIVLWFTINQNIVWSLLSQLGLHEKRWNLVIVMLKLGVESINI